MTAARDKKQIRMQALSARDRLLSSVRKQCSEAIVRRVRKYVTFTDVSAPVMAYMPFRSEADITPLIASIWQAGYPVLLPRIIPGTRRMVPCLAGSFADLRQGQWGIWEPAEHAPGWNGEISCMLVPGAAFDERGNRIGYGAGFYDRFIEQLASEGKNPKRIGIAFEVQVCKQLPAEPHDIPMHMIITESRAIMTRQARTQSTQTKE